ncbi:hypothetical protein [Burkholderia vietnamiensis]|uniref:hypothetical protein n=1 Tax=Burkholderia vietnamiensis TaxID=60552 RepID=UPI001CF2B92C|nr:hypothetical protein [Burkholderia vietnamiensis]MCA8287540.1 hypothetical protein [Burkholderia vietnamiensis]
MTITTTPLEKLERAIRTSVYCVAIAHDHSYSETMRMEFDATAFVTVTVDGVDHLVMVKRQAGNGCPAIEEDEKSGYAALNAALDKVLGTGPRHDIDWRINDKAGEAFKDDVEARKERAERLVNVVRAVEATGDKAARDMVADTLARALLETHTQVVNHLNKVRAIAHLVAIKRVPQETLDGLLTDMTKAYKRIKSRTGVGLEALRKAAEVPVAEVAGTLDTLYTDVVLP